MSDKAILVTYRPQILVLFAGFCLTFQGVGLKRLPTGPVNVFWFSFTAGVIELIFTSIARCVLDRIKSNSIRNTAGVIGTSTAIATGTGAGTTTMSHPVVKSDISREVAVLLATRATLGFIGSIFAFMAIGLLPLGEAMALFLTSPIFAALGACFILGEQILAHEWGNLMACFMGALCIAIPPVLGHKSPETVDAIRGTFYAICTALCSAGSFLSIRAMGSNVAIKTRWTNISFAHASGQILGSASCLFFLTMFNTVAPPVTTTATTTSGHHVHAHINPAAATAATVEAPLMSLQLLPILLAAASAGATSHICMAYGVRKCKASHSGILRGAEVLWGFAAQLCFTSDPVSLTGLCGGLLIVSSVFLTLFFGGHPNPATTPAINNPLPVINHQAARFASDDGTDLTVSPPTEMTCLLGGGTGMGLGTEAAGDCGRDCESAGNITATSSSNTNARNKSNSNGDSGGVSTGDVYSYQRQPSSSCSSSVSAINSLRRQFSTSPSDGLYLSPPAPSLLRHALTATATESPEQLFGMHSYFQTMYNFYRDDEAPLGGGYSGGVGGVGVGARAANVGARARAGTGTGAGAVGGWVDDNGQVWEEELESLGRWGLLGVGLGRGLGTGDSPVLSRSRRATTVTSRSNSALPAGFETDSTTESAYADGRSRRASTLPFPFDVDAPPPPLTTTATVPAPTTAQTAAATAGVELTPVSPRTLTAINQQRAGAGGRLYQPQHVLRVPPVTTNAVVIPTPSAAPRAPSSIPGSTASSAPESLSMSLSPSSTGSTASKTSFTKK